QQAFQPDVLIEVRPFHGIAVTQQDNVLPLSGRGMPKAWIPCQRDRERPPIGEDDHELLVRDVGGNGRGFVFKYQRSHSMPPLRFAGSPSPKSRSWLIHVRQSPCS